MREGRTTVLGGFTPPGDLPYWLVKVTSRFDREWLIALIADEPARQFRVAYLDQVVWKHWDGRADGKRLQDGDNPATFAQLYTEATRHGL